ncbi:MAG: hypothetical protein KGJ62_14945 [Armatimonadetes bacterium]|nr:hypothetical protein [Armatimonadota bacterium]MDE2206165.1 hypothetical protein [Armatimonadota bacterium]
MVRLPIYRHPLNLYAIGWLYEAIHEDGVGSSLSAEILRRAPLDRGQFATYLRSPTLPPVAWWFGDGFSPEKVIGRALTPAERDDHVFPGHKDDLLVTLLAGHLRRNRAWVAAACMDGGYPGRSARVVGEDGSTCPPVPAPDEVAGRVRGKFWRHEGEWYLTASDPDDGEELRMLVEWPVGGFPAWHFWLSAPPISVRAPAAAVGAEIDAEDARVLTTSVCAIYFGAYDNSGFIEWLAPGVEPPPLEGVTA